MDDKILPGYIRVSEILRHLKDFSHIDPEVLQNKCIIGTNVHKAIEDDLSGEFPCIEESPPSYYHSFMHWKNTFNPLCVLKEERLYCHKLKITGQIDAIMKFPGDEARFLIDFKTSANECPLTWPLQAHFYYYLYRANYKEPIANRFIFLKLDKKGGMPRAFNYFYDENTMQRCFKELTIYRANNA